MTQTTQPPMQHAPGMPGIAPTWTSSDKDMVGTAMGPARLWYTLGHGIVNEVFYPRIDIPQIRDLGFIVADGAGFWVELKRLHNYTLTTPAPGVPLPVIVHRHPRFTLTLRVCPDAARDVLLIDLALEGDPGLRPYVLLAPHLGGSGRDNLAWADTYHGRGVLWAEQGPFGLALLASADPFQDALGPCSAGYVGASDGWQDFAAHDRMLWRHAEAGPGNVALMAGLTCQTTLALGFSASKEAAATLALAALTQPFATHFELQQAAWSTWHDQRKTHCPPPNLPPELQAQFDLSAQVLKTHSDKTFVGALVASLSVPWGNRSEERGGYHLVWPRDLAECAQALLALGGDEEARDVLSYLIATQNPDGHWHQNQWLGGKPYWQGIQLDEAAFPVLLAAALAERGGLAGIPVDDMVRRALGFLVREGPASPQDRWEEDAGVNPFTMAACIAALVAGAELLPEPERALPLAVADFWNARLEDWCTTQDTPLAKAYGITAYYVREAPAAILSLPAAMCRTLPIKNHGRDPGLTAAAQVGVDFLQLVRLGLRRPDDPLILNTVKLVDVLLKSDTPAGPVWHRYNGDGYGEHADGRPFDGTGHGRGWPLLGGERGHFALAGGADPLPYLAAMNAMTGAGGLIPEQVWDTAPLPQRGLEPGRPSGSAMPLAWAHAEFVKLAVSRALGHPFDRPAAVWQRYGGARPDAANWIWTPGAPIRHLAAGKSLWLVLPQAGVLHIGVDGWHSRFDLPTLESGSGLHGVELAAARLAGHHSLQFTWRWQADGNWLGEDFNIQLEA
jgi:glucoamylase